MSPYFFQHFVSLIFSHSQLFNRGHTNLASAAAYGKISLLISLLLKKFTYMNMNLVKRNIKKTEICKLWIIKFVPGIQLIAFILIFMVILASRFAFQHHFLLLKTFVKMQQILQKYFLSLNMTNNSPWLNTVVLRIE
jgi:membrane-bound metal-dependent hydrolase YbcI (DUF457 family)